MVTSEIIRQVFHIQSCVGSGTGFTVSVEGKQYLVTARHVLDADGKCQITKQLSIDVMYSGRWHSLTCNLVGIGKDHFDIAVLALPRALAIFPEVTLGSKGLIYGQETYFLGFPYGLQVNFGSLNNDFPLPFVKRAIVSMVNGLQQPLVVLDGINNSGFSGGPVVFRNQSGAWQIAAVVSGYSSVREPVFVGKTDTPSDYTYELNTGLIDACPMDIALDLIRANPIGFSL